VHQDLNSNNPKLCSSDLGNTYPPHLTINTMGNLLYVIAVVLLIAWLIGFVGYNAGGIIHILLVIAVIAVILRIIQGKSVL
jgi:hypothetical protein